MGATACSFLPRLSQRYRWREAFGDEFPHPLTQRAPEVLAFLTAELGMHALEASWQEITGQSLPEAVRDYVLSWATTNSQPEGER